MIWSFLLTSIFWFGLESFDRAQAEDKEFQLQPIEKIAVFPVFFEGERGERLEQSTLQSLEDTWWQVREELTDTGRLTVASRAFLQKADAFQPRGNLSVGDAVILGRYVEADAVMTLSLRSRTFSISVWDSNAALLVWTQSVELHPSVLIREQLAKVARGLVKEFIAAIPYQGITIQDALAREALVEVSGKKTATVKVGISGASSGNATSRSEKGDPVRWVEFERVGIGPLFQGGLKTKAIAEGVVVSQKDSFLKVELTRILSGEAIRTGAVVQLSKVMDQLSQLARPREAIAGKSMVTAVAASLTDTAAIEPEGLQVVNEEERKKPVATTFSLLSSLAVVLLLAF